MKYYFARMASTGFNVDAVMAGVIPEIMPMIEEITKPCMT